MRRATTTTAVLVSIAFLVHVRSAHADPPRCHGAAWDAVAPGIDTTTPVAPVSLWMQDPGGGERLEISRAGVVTYLAYGAAPRPLCTLDVSQRAGLITILESTPLAHASARPPPAPNAPSWTEIGVTIGPHLRLARFAYGPTADSALRELRRRLHDAIDAELSPSLEDRMTAEARRLIDTVARRNARTSHCDPYVHVWPEAHISAVNASFEDGEYHVVISWCEADEYVLSETGSLQGAVAGCFDHAATFVFAPAASGWRMNVPHSFEYRLVGPPATSCPVQQIGFEPRVLHAR